MKHTLPPPLLAEVSEGKFVALGQRNRSQQIPDKTAQEQPKRYSRTELVLSWALHRIAGFFLG